jgi:hypothetical protein
MTRKFPAMSAAEKNALQALDAATAYATRLDRFNTLAGVLSDNGDVELFFVVIGLLGERFFDGGGHDFEKALQQAGIDDSRVSALNDLHQTLSNADMFAALVLGFAWGRLSDRGPR